MPINFTVAGIPPAVTTAVIVRLRQTRHRRSRNRSRAGGERRERNEVSPAGSREDGDIMLSSGCAEACMAQLVVRNIEERVKAGLQRRARRNGRSMEQEVR